MDLERVLSKIEDFYEAVASVEGLEVMPAVLKPVSEKALADFMRKSGLALPEEVQTLWRRGLRHASASLEEGERFASAHFDFYSLKNLARDLPGFRQLGEQVEGEERRLVTEGVPLSFSQPQLVVDAGPGRTRGAVYHYSTRNPLQPPVAPSLSTFLEHWLAAGCFSSHDFAAWFPRVQHLVPVHVPPRQNLWLQHHDRQFGTRFAR